jgi:hypothetical protein
MEKEAKSTDPIQQALRDHKKRFNLAAKEFIKRIIAFKKGLNGRGDPGYGLPPGTIGDPLPKELASFLNEITGNFEQLASEALKIEQEQALYSQNRRKPQEEKPAEALSAEPPKAASNNSNILLKLSAKWRIDE